ncbi:hypothetical protein BDW71DRAFT_178017 [Aspergillus fruticulosus]
MTSIVCALFLKLLTLLMITFSRDRRHAEIRRNYCSHPMEALHRHQRSITFRTIQMCLIHPGIALPQLHNLSGAPIDIAIDGTGISSLRQQCHSTRV